MNLDALEQASREAAEVHSRWPHGPADDITIPYAEECGRFIALASPSTVLDLIAIARALPEDPYRWDFETMRDTLLALAKRIEAAAAQRALVERAACKSCGRPREVHVMPCPRCTVNVHIEIDDNEAAALTATTAPEGE